MAELEYFAAIADYDPEGQEVPTKTSPPQRPCI